MGIQGFLYKVAAEKRCDTARTTFIFMATVAALSFIFWAHLREPMGNLATLTILAFVNSLTFLAATMSFIEALKFVPATTAYSVARLNLVILTIFSFVWFHDRLSMYQISGIVIALAAMLTLTKGMNQGEAKQEHFKKGFAFLMISLFTSAIAAISSKYAAMYVGKLSFLAFVYSIAALSSAALFKKPNINTPQSDKAVATVTIGLAMGILNFFGYYAFLMALFKGPLSLVASITGMHFVVSVLLSILIYREKLTSARLVGFFLTILSIVLLSL
ncbi:MAG: prediced transporter protein [Deltaproteobacteria bacterium]|nr:prediced transporter protein [Deltaproteobacteria bacterium]